MAIDFFFDFFFNFMVFCCFAGVFCFFCLFVCCFFLIFFVIFLFLCVRLFVFGSFILVGFFIRSLRMVADSRHREKNVQNREKTFIIEKNFQNQGKDFRIQKNISGSKTKLWNLEKNQNRENMSESRKLFQNREKCLRIEKYFVTRAEKKTWIQWSRIPVMFQVNNKNMIQVYKKNSRMTSVTLFWYFYC